ncbi:AI-2E family transporter [Kocuria sediminis]|uniref:AI-2E family transporter n=1 Tax=Kocuria sediminis TaxID=1038857 RepID=A0A6N8GNS9_9MICC|nr:AI-2E family transporter [Kocuria sediminis]MUN62474.1 AI-2E family transporter [Kocuria sediminis]
MPSTAHDAERPPVPGPSIELPPLHGNAAGGVAVSVRVAAAWSWRLLIILAAVGLFGYMLSTITVVIIPVLIAGLLAGLLFPLVKGMRAQHVPAGLASGLTVLGFIGLVVGLLVLAGRQIVLGFAQLSENVVVGTQQLLGWLEDGPLNLSADSVNDWIDDLGTTVQDNSQAILNGAMSFGSTAGNVLTGIIIMLFTLLFFLMDGERIWLFLVRLFPVSARRAVNGAGRRGWHSLVQYARIQGFVAFVDAVGIGLGAALLGVPLALPIGILVFLGSFIPIVGAVLTGAVAVLVALVANGFGNALAMLAVVLLVQQIESNVLQPLVMGRAVSLHPLAVFLAVASGTILFGIAGALFAVPVMAFLNTVVRYLVGGLWRQDDEIAWEPYFFPWEIKKHASRNELTRDQIMAQLQRFRRTRAQERLQAALKRGRKADRARAAAGTAGRPGDERPDQAGAGAGKAPGRPPGTD